jgi:Fur family peroxide stress response transcriptional regulator
MLHSFEPEVQFEEKEMRIEQKNLIREFRGLCRQVGFKVTTPRLVIYRYLKDNKEHPGVDRVWEAVRKDLPTISRESVYRILNDFASQGIISILDRADVVARYDANTKRHDHFYCEKCGRFFDFEIKELPMLVDAKVRSLGKIERAEVRVRGICNECLAKEKNVKMKTIH